VLQRDFANNKSYLDSTTAYSTKLSFKEFSISWRGSQLTFKEKKALYNFVSVEDLSEEIVGKVRDFGIFQCCVLVI